jgi:hypothetical protein
MNLSTVHNDCRSWFGKAGSCLPHDGNEVVTVVDVLIAVYRAVWELLSATIWHGSAALKGEADLMVIGH